MCRNCWKRIVTQFALGTLTGGGAVLGLAMVVRLVS